MLENILVSVLVGVASALVATYLAFRRFRAEKLWEKKVDAYTRLITAAHEMRRAREAEIDAQRRGTEIPDEYSKRIWTESHDARRTLLHLSDAASFLISDEIEAATVALKKSLEHAIEADTWIERLLQEDEALSEYLIRLKSVAKKELRV